MHTVVLYLIIHGESKQPIHLTFDIITSANVVRFTKFFHCQIFEEISYTYITKILHLTLSAFLHYFVNLENYNSC